MPSPLDRFLPGSTFVRPRAGVAFSARLMPKVASDAARSPRFVRTDARLGFVAFGVLVATLAGAPTLATAQGAPGRPQTLDPMVVTASRTSQPISDVLADVSVIGPDEIARAGVDSVVELLQRQPGVEITQTGGPATRSGVYLRGANTGQTLVLIDGVRFSSATEGTTTLEAIPLDQVERIEIVRGPASSLYGADAIGGVIQIFTKKGGGTPTANASASYGTYNTWDVKAGVTGSADALTYALQLAAKESAGFNAMTNPAAYNYNPDPDGYTNQSVSASLGYTFAPDQVLTAQYLRSRLNTSFDSGIPVAAQTITTAQTWQVTSRNRLASFWTSQLTAASGLDDAQTQTIDGSQPFRTTQNQFTWQNDFVLPAGTLTAGYDHRVENVANDANFAVTSRTTNSYFGVYRLNAGQQALQANLRNDDSSQYGSQTTGGIAYAYRVSPSLRLTAGYSTGFKPPSFNDLYYPGFGNPDLKPETSRNVEGGIYWNGSVADANVEARAIVYRNKVQDLIVIVCDVDWNCQPQNVDSATLEGVTLAMDVQATGGATLGASLDLQSPTNDANGKLLPRRSRQHGAVTVGYPVGPLRLGAEVVASGLRYNDVSNRVQMGGYAIVNLTAEYALPNRVTLFVRGTNVLDKNYELAAGYATGGAMWLAGVRAQFR